MAEIPWCASCSSELPFERKLSPVVVFIALCTVSCLAAAVEAASCVHWVGLGSRTDWGPGSCRRAFITLILRVAPDCPSPAKRPRGEGPEQ